MSYNKIYLKITSLPQTEDLQTDSLEFEIFKNKYSEAREYMKDSDVLHSYITDGSKTPSFAKIYSITIGCEVNGKPFIKVMKGKEKDILNNLLTILHSEDFKTAELVCYNLGFNLGFLTTRMLANGISLGNVPACLNHFGKKMWQLKNSKDLSEHFSGASWFRPNFQELCFTAGLKTENILDGSDVYLYYKAGKEKEIDQSDINYLFNLINIERISQDAEVFKDFSSNVEKIGEVKEVEDNRTVLEKLYEANELTEPIKEEIKELRKGVRLLKKDRENMKDILLSVYQQKGDKKAVKEDKKEEIQELINEL